MLQPDKRSKEREEGLRAERADNVIDLSKEEIQALHEKSIVCDIHAHPPLKTFLFKKELDKVYKASSFQNPFTLRSNLPSLRAGSVNIVLATTHIPEKDLRADAWPLRGIAKLWKKLDHIFTAPDDQLTFESIDEFEEAVAKTSEKSDEFLRITKSHTELHDALAEGKLALLHAVEGGHSLNGKIENLDKLFERGVCMLTLAHFYDNDITGSAGGIPEDLWIKKLGILRKAPSVDKGLSEFGRDVVERMFEIGMLIDLVHTSPVGRSEIVEINSKKRPLIISHTGVQAIMPDPLNVSDDEIRAVADTGGVIGVIAMNHWLIGKDGKDGLQFMVDTAKHLVNVGGEDILAFGSDFDGFTNPPNDFKEPADFPKLTAALSKKFSPRVIEKALGGNFLRALKAGWDRY